MLLSIIISVLSYIVFSVGSIAKYAYCKYEIFIVKTFMYS